MELLWTHVMGNSLIEGPRGNTGTALHCTARDTVMASWQRWQRTPWTGGMMPCMRSMSNPWFAGEQSEEDGSTFNEGLSHLRGYSM